MGETEEKKTYEVLLPLEKYEALVNDKYEALLKNAELQATADSYRDKYWHEREKAESLDKRLVAAEEKAVKVTADLETYRLYFQQNASASTEFNMWLAEYKGDDEA